MSRLKQLLVIRKDLNMSIGKLIAQAVHASQRSGEVPDYTATRMPACIVVYVKTEKALLKLQAKCDDIGIPNGLQRDGGRTELPVDTITALSIGPAVEEEVDKIGSRLQVVKGRILWD